MYEEFFGLTCKPFQITPDPEFLYLSGTHRKALNYLEYGIQENSGFILITGEIGAGKTTLLRHVMKSLPRTVHVARIFNTRVDDRTLLWMINEEFGIETQGRSKAEIQRDLNRFLIEKFSKGEQCVLMIDEAQNLSRDLLEEVRLLSNLETDKNKLLQIVLVGQPELRAMLLRADLEQFSQRITVGCHLRPLRPEETEAYVRHRLRIAGNEGAVTFEDGVFEEIFRFSGGIPRVINVICEWALLSAFSEQTKHLSLELIHEITEEMEADRRTGLPSPAGDGPEREESAERTASPAELENLSRELADVRERLSHLERLVTRLGISVLERLVRSSETGEELGETVAFLESAFGRLAGKKEGESAGDASAENRLRLLKKDDVA